MSSNQTRTEYKGNQSSSPRDAPSHPTGPTSTEGVEAHDLPDQGEGNVDTDPGRELGRNVPSHSGEVHGSTINNDVGIAGTPDMRQADQKSAGPRRHQGDK